MRLFIQDWKGQPSPGRWKHARRCELDPTLWPGHAALLEVPTAQAIVNAAQMNVIALPTWNSGKAARP